MVLARRLRDDPGDPGVEVERDREALAGLRRLRELRLPAVLDALVDVPRRRDQRGERRARSRATGSCRPARSATATAATVASAHARTSCAAPSVIPSAQA